MTANLSGEYQLDLTLNDIVAEALDVLQVRGSGEPADPFVTQQAKSSLNMLLKLWESQGIHLWSNEEYTLFLEVGKRIYDLNDPATRCVGGEVWVKTALAADAVATDTSITVEDDTELKLGQAIGIVENSLNLFWTVIQGLPGAGVVELRDALINPANAGNRVRAYDTADLSTTTLSVAAAATDTTINVASAVAIDANYLIGIEDDLGGVLWTTVNSVDVGASTVTLNDSIINASSIGNDVITFSSEQNYIPISRIPNKESMRRHSGETSDYEIPIVMASREEYFQLPNKEQRGTPIQVYFERREPQGKFYVWNAPFTAVEYLNFTAERELQILENPDDTFDLPTEWYLALTYNLAKLMIPKVGCSTERKQLIMGSGKPGDGGLAEEFLDQVLSFDSDVYGIQMVPEQDYG